MLPLLSLFLQRRARAAAQGWTKGLCYPRSLYSFSGEREQLLRAGLKGCKVDLSPSDWADAAAATEGYSGADIKTVANAAAFLPLRELHTARFWTFTTGQTWNIIVWNSGVAFDVHLLIDMARIKLHMHALRHIVIYCRL